MFLGIKSKAKSFFLRRKWKKINSHNFTTVSGNFDIDCVTVGYYTYGEINVHIANKGYILKIGNFCSIGPDVRFLLCSEHNIDTISTYPFKTMIVKTGPEATSKGNIVVDDDVWIGYGAIILSGVHIGQGAIVAAGAVVTKDVPPYAIVGGNPAKIIRYRFNEPIIKELLKIDYFKLTKDNIENHINELYLDLNSVDQLNWIPKKNYGVN